MAACSDLEYIDCNISQIADMFGVDATGLASQLRVHNQDVIPDRERLRAQLGIADNFHRGARPQYTEAYARAVELYRDTDMTIAQVAEACDVSAGGLSRHLRFYHKSVIELKESLRQRPIKKAGSRKAGKLAGNGNLYGPKPETVAKYAQALELYRTTSMTIREIAAAARVPLQGFAGYLRRWHSGEKPNGRGLKSTAAKYAQAIKSLKENPRHVAAAAAEHGLNPDTFRRYLKAHEPGLVSQHGMMRLADGKAVKRSCAEKYAKAISEYASTPEPLKSIAQRHGLAYKSLAGYVVRNCPAEREAHQRLASIERNTNK